MSWIAAMSDEERSAWLERVRTLIGEGETPAEMTTHVVIGVSALA